MGASLDILDTIDIALSFLGVDIVGTPFDGDGIDPVGAFIILGSNKRSSGM